MKNKAFITGIRKAGALIVLTIAIAGAAAGCGKSLEASGDAASSAAETGSDFAKVISKDSSLNESAPTELKVGSLILEIPGYYSLDADNSSGSDIGKIYTYEAGKSGAALVIGLLDAPGVSDSEFRDSKDSVQGMIEENFEGIDDFTLTKVQETEYMSMPGFSCDFSGEDGGVSVTADVDVFLDSSAGKYYFFLFAKVGDPKRDVASDYGNMMKNALWSGSTTVKSKESAGTKDDSPSDGKSESDPAGVDPDLKATLDSYEKIMNEYCDFMEKYENLDSADVFSMLGDYYKMLEEYTDAMDVLNQLDTGNMSTADYKYYLDVTSRVSKRLLEVAE